MLILGIDTSCDDTSASVVEDGKRILSNIVSSQEDIHKKYGGIVPELASRRHIEMIWPVVDEALKSANTKLDELSAVAVCYGPGLIGSLLVGCSFAKSVCFSKGIPLVSVNHIEGHIFSSFLDEGGPLVDKGFAQGAPEFPFISLIVSGGHTSLYRVDGFRRYKELGRTRDDAAGEAYDKVAKLLGLGYPGGPAIDRLAHEGNPAAVDFPRAYLPGDFDFSFSGLKTAVLNFLRTKVGSRKPNAELRTLNSELVKDICASFQQAVVDVLVRKTEWAAKEEKVRRVTISGGVGANSALRRELALMAKKGGLQLFIPPAALCTDNAAMIAAAAYHHFITHDIAGMELNPVAYLPL
ncbi:MAG: tRNA (adenosine(37)-N6)-threonylcarbamoyltransferase complex transferase subunit TsaD [Nitrospirae bacterium]|nr:tRNA (adenosine(37)-N6)-threonylcarbamoyltransferase complex transferase subunit TsaD [Nitrospirota bacterium]MCL5422113.1 tRNA (adenosine(37)-N6)-threonylcarbamoyltransferase complex transferase subunit TsaD [Nitrospirota bacterium]